MKHKQLLINLIFAVVVLGIAGGWFAWRAAHRTGAAALTAALTYGDANTVLDIPLTKDATYDVDTGSLEDIVSDKGMTATDKALEVFTWGTRGQYFWDGNKRTSLMLANKILISAGAGIMTITDKYMEQFNVLLLEYYNTGKSSELKRFLYDNAIRHTW